MTSSTRARVQPAAHAIPGGQVVIVGAVRGIEEAVR
jgi:hypothetical protein